MGIRVDEHACNGCGTAEEPMCVRDCPGDLMFLQANGKAAITSNRECWDCAACVKVCPTQAIELRLPTSLVVGDVRLKGRALKHKTLWSIRLRPRSEHGDDASSEQTYETPSTGRAPFAPSL